MKPDVLIIWCFSLGFLVILLTNLCCHGGHHSKFEDSEVYREELLQKRRVAKKQYFQFICKSVWRLLSRSIYKCRCSSFQKENIAQTDLLIVEFFSNLIFSWEWMCLLLLLKQSAIATLKRTFLYRNEKLSDI